MNWRPREDSNLCSRLRRAVLYPLSYGGRPGRPGLGNSSKLRGTRSPPYPVAVRPLRRLAILLAWLLLLQDPSVWVLIAVLAALQLLTEVVIGFNYAFGQVLVTPMALLMTYLGAARALGPEMASERIVETLIGVAVGVVLSVVFSSADERAHLAHRIRPAPDR